MRKKNLWKKGTALAMATALSMAALSACGTTPTEEGNVESEGSKEEASGDESVEAGTSDSFIADRKITVQAYVDDIGYSLPEDLMSTPVMQEIKEITGVELEILYTPGDSDSSVLAAHLASGTVADVVITYLNNSSRPEFVLLDKAASEGMFADVSEYMANSEVYSKYMEEGYLPNDAYKNITFREDYDGVYLMQLSIPAVDRSMEYNPEQEYVGGMYIRKDIAEDLGIDPTAIRTQEEFYDLLVDIKEGGYVDANGQAVYPLGPKYWGGSPDALDYIVGGYHWGVSDNYNMDEDGQVYHEAQTDYVYDKIDFVRTLLEEELINPEFFTMDEIRSKEVSETGNSAIIADVHNYMPIIYETGEWIPLGPLNAYDGDNSKIVSGKGGYGAWAISANAENPEEIFEFFDWLSTEEGKLLGNYGIEGEHYNMVDGKPVVTEEVLTQINDGNSDWLINNVGASFGGAGVVFWEYAMTDVDWLEEFGESRPGASQGGGYEGAIQIATDYPREKRLVEGLPATAYLSMEGFEDTKVQMGLINYEEMLVQAMYAGSDDEIEQIVESFRNQLEQAGIEEFTAYLEEEYAKDPKSINFY